jgi:tetratricopeptide (TPR) repeat protein
VAILLAAALVSVTLVTMGTGTGTPESSEPQATMAGEKPGRAATDPSARSVDGLQERLRRLPEDWTAWAALGTTYVERARITGDPTYYPKAEKALSRSLGIRPNGNDAALAGQAALAAARHNFGEALRLAEAAIAVNPYSSAAHGIRFDALVELGRYPQAWEAGQTQVDLRPDVSSLSRVEYAFELRGQTAEAGEVLRRVLADATSASDAAFAYYHLGELARNDGDLARADDAFTRGLARVPSDTLLLAGKARLDAASGRTADALAGYETVIARAPQPGLVIEYGELLESLGRDEQAQVQYSLARSTASLFRAQGVDVDVELAVFEADHGDPAAALRDLPPPAASPPPPGAEPGASTPTAKAPRRAGIFVDDARAWVLHRLGRDADALPYAHAAVALGTHRALFRYHLGVIEAALGQRDAATADLRAALAMDPHFSPLHAPRAQALLTSLEDHR